MDFLTLAAERHSVREFKNIPVSSEHLEKILMAGHLAPTGCNFQPQRILVVNSEAGLEKLRLSTKCTFGCSAALIVCYNRDECWTRKYDGMQSGECDASIVCTHMMLEAYELGVGSTWVMHFDPAALKENFNIPENFEPVAILVMGYPADNAKIHPMHDSFRDISETVFYEKF